MRAEKQGEGRQQTVIETAPYVSAGIDADGRHDQATDQVAFRGEAHAFLPIGFGSRGQAGTLVRGPPCDGLRLTLRRRCVGLTDPTVRSIGWPPGTPWTLPCPLENLAELVYW